MGVIRWRYASSARLHARFMAAGLLWFAFSVGHAWTGGQALIAVNPGPNAVQAQGMAGYILNAETGMNAVYTRKLNRELMNPPNNGQIDDSPVIQYEGSPPVQPLPNALPPYPPVRVRPTGGSGLH